jgi:hypothetical protein
MLPSAPPVSVAQPHVAGHAHAIHLAWYLRWWKAIRKKV